MLDQVLEYVNLYNDTSARVIGNSATRTEVQSYPDPSLREIVVNAFAHFDASFPSDIKIEFYLDRVEIASPGALYRTTMKEVLSGRQSFRNPNLVYVLNKFNYIENYATGLKKTLAAYAPYDKKPKYESTDHFFVVTLPNVNYDTIENDTEKETVNDTVNDTVKQVLNCIKNNNAITIAVIMKELGKSRPTITRAIAELKEKGYIERIGPDKSGSWKVLR